MEITTSKLKEKVIEDQKKLIKIFEEDGLSDEDKLEFFEVYKLDIIKMLKNKLKELEEM